MIASLVRTVRPIEEVSTGPSETVRILVVDDNAGNRDLLLRRLSHDGHHVARANWAAARWKFSRLRRSI